MKLLLAATLVLSAISQDETSLMQGLFRGSETSTSVLPPPPGQQATLCSLGPILLHCAAAGVASVACQAAVERLQLSVLQMCGTGATETENQCLCKGGTGATGTECPANDAYKCHSCNEGWWLQVTDDTAWCVEQVTWSYNGQCTSKVGWDECSTCPSGFVVVSCIGGQRCIYEHNLNNCAALRVDTATGDLECSSCNQGWWLPATSMPMCVENQCRCDGGTGATGTECPANDAYKCSTPWTTYPPQLYGQNWNHWNQP